MPLWTALGAVFALCAHTPRKHTTTTTGGPGGYAAPGAVPGSAPQGRFRPPRELGQYVRSMPAVPKSLLKLAYFFF